VPSVKLTTVANRAFLVVRSRTTCRTTWHPPSRYPASVSD